MIKTWTKPNNYMDSIFLMKAGREIMEADGVKNAVVVMGTDMNKTVLKEFGGLDEAAQKAGPNDLIVAVEIKDATCLKAVEECIVRILDKKEKSSGVREGGTKHYRFLRQASQENPELNLAVISLPGEFAADEAKKALETGMHVFMFSDNVPLEDELEIKRIGREKNLLVMGPGAGTAVIDGVSIGLMSKIRRGRVGIVAASGSGLQEVAMLLHQYGLGISQAIGTGGRDLSKAVGGSTMLMGIDILRKDPETDVVVLISKPPHPDTQRKMFEAVRTFKKPTVIFFLGGNRADVESSGAYYAATLEQLAVIASALARGKTPETADFKIGVERELEPLAAAERARHKPGQKYLRGLFCGGTHSEEAVLLVQDILPDLNSNLNFGKVTLLKNRHISVKNTLVDMGDEEFTVGRPHPVMDPSILNGRLLQEGSDPETRVLLFDLLLGYGVHPDPVGTIEDTLRTIRAKTEQEGRYISMVASVCGTDMDPQNYMDQIRRLKELGVVVLQSNGRASVLAGMIAKED